MKKNVKIKITLTDAKTTLEGENLHELTENDIIDSIKMLVSLAKTLGILEKEGTQNGKCVPTAERRH